MRREELAAGPGCASILIATSTQPPLSSDVAFAFLRCFRPFLFVFFLGGGSGALVAREAPGGGMSALIPEACGGLCRRIVYILTAAQLRSCAPHHTHSIAFLYSIFTPGKIVYNYHYRFRIPRTSLRRFARVG